MSNKYKTVSIVIPVYNEEKTILQILKKVLRADTLGLKKEVIVVNDGSTDGTGEILKRYGKDIVLLKHRLNQGKGKALRTGFAKAKGEIILVQDADLEYDPTDYPMMLTPFLTQGAKAVFGSRELAENTRSHPLFFAGGKIVTFTTRVLFGGRLTDVPTGYKAVLAKVLKKQRLKCVQFEFCPELAAKLLQNKVRIVEVPIRYTPRKIQEGKKIGWLDGLTAIVTLIKIRLGTWK